MTDDPKTMPARIWAEQEPYDFPGYSPCWVWHGERPEDGVDGLTEYVRAPLPADDAEMVERVARAIREAESRIHALPRRGGPPGKVYTTIARAALSAMRGEP